MNRREFGVANNEKPFYGEQQVKTIQKYSEHWIKILRYIWRTADEERRPQYRLTKQQQAQLGEVQSAAERCCDGNGGRRQRSQGRMKLQRACMAFWIAMFNHELKDKTYDSAIMSGLAVLGMDTQDGGWMPALNYTPILAAMVTVLRALVVFRSWQRKQAAVREAVKGGATVEDAEAEVRAIKDGVQALANRFMTLVQYDGIVSPMDRILHQKTYGMKIRFTTKGEGRVAWQDGDRITIDKISFTMGDIRTVVHGLTETVRTRLTQELMFLGPARGDIADSAAVPAAMLPALDLAHTFDNAAEMTEGWSFLQDVRNSFAVDGTRWL